MFLILKLFFMRSLDFLELEYQKIYNIMEAI